MNEDLKFHWFCFSYKGSCNETGRQADASTYVGYPERKVTLAMIQANKKSAGVTDSACLIAVSYLGEMSKSEFAGETHD